MANQLFGGFLFTDAGVAINGATADLLDRNTTTPVRATTTTNASGYWAISHATEGRFDVRITNGSSVRWHKYDTQSQIDTLEVANFNIRNPADTFDYAITPAAITADRILNLPLITGTDTLAVLGLAATFSAAQTFSGGVIFTTTQVEVADDILFTLGNDNDIVLLNRSSILATNTALTGVMVGTPVTPAVAANSVIVSNVTASGDYLLALNVGGNSQAWQWVDSSAGTQTLYAAGVARWLLNSTGGSFTGTISDLGIVTTVDINGGTLDGTVIGGASAAAATVTTLTLTGATLALPSGNAISWNAGDITLTHAADKLTLGGGDFYVSTGGMIVGHTAQLVIGTGTPESQFTGTSGATTNIAQQRFSADSGGPALLFGKSRAATAGTYTIVQDNDELANFHFLAADGVDMDTFVARIRVEVDDAAPAASDIGAALVMQLASGGGADDIREVFRIAANGNISFGAITPTIAVTGTRIAQSYHTSITSTNAVTVDSSETIKHEIAPYTGDALALIRDMDVITYRHDRWLDNSDQLKLGIRAESVKEPLAITMIERDGGGLYPGVNLYGIIAIQARAIQQLETQVAELRRAA